MRKRAKSKGLKRSGPFKCQLRKSYIKLGAKLCRRRLQNHECKLAANCAKQLCTIAFNLEFDEVEYPYESLTQHVFERKPKSGPHDRRKENHREEKEECGGQACATALLHWRRASRIRTRECKRAADQGWALARHRKVARRVWCAHPQCVFFFHGKDIPKREDLEKK